MEAPTEVDVGERHFTPTQSSYIEPTKPVRAVSSYVSVIGHPGDRQAVNSGVPNMLEVVELLRAESIPCCMMDVPPLQYYGAARSRSVGAECR